MAGQLSVASGIKRKGLVLSFLMRFKQICNHPSQWLGDGAWSEAESGKWARLREIAEVVAARQRLRRQGIAVDPAPLPRVWLRHGGHSGHLVFT